MSLTHDFFQLSVVDSYWKKSMLAFGTVQHLCDRLRLRKPLLSTVTEQTLCFYIDWRNLSYQLWLERTTEKLSVFDCNWRNYCDRLWQEKTIWQTVSKETSVIDSGGKNPLWSTLTGEIQLSTVTEEISATNCDWRDLCDRLWQKKISVMDCVWRNFCDRLWQKKKLWSTVTEETSVINCN